MPIDDDPPARNLFLPDPERLHREPFLIPGRAMRFADRHELVRRSWEFGDTIPNCLKEGKRHITDIDRS